MKLTYDDDRLPTLAGLASRFAEMLDTSYLAGLWLSDLWRGLLWKRDLDVICRRLSGPKATLPTWSWAGMFLVRFQEGCCTLEAHSQKCHHFQATKKLSATISSVWAYSRR